MIDPVPRGRTVDALLLGPARRRRRMSRLLAELDRLPEDRIGHRPHRRRSPAQRTVTGLTAVGLVGAIGLVVADRELGVTVDLHGLHRSTPLGRPPTVEHGRGSFAFLAHQPGRPGVPVAYDPCHEVHLEVNDALAPPGGDAIVREAVREVARDTGLRIVVDGRTDRQPTYQMTMRFVGAGLARSPGLVAWTTPDQVKALAGRVVGVGGSASVEAGSTGDRVYVTGIVALDTPALTGVLQEPHGRALVRAVVLHELGHLVGLGHVHDPGELMNADNNGLVGFGPGDREGLADLGSGRCYPGDG